MKNKGFTIIEVLAVMVILAIIIGIALISVTRYRSKVDNKELSTLHSTISAAYENYRNDEVTKGNIIKDITIDNNASQTDPFLSYLSGISYAGERINTKYFKLQISLHTKGEVLTKASYNEYVNSRITGSNPVKIKKSSNSDPVTATVEDIYVIDSTCEVTHNATTETDLSNDNINKTCKKTNGSYVASKEDLICIKVVYKDETIINDFDKNATGFNKLCNFVS